MNSKKKVTGLKEDGKAAFVPKLRFPEFRGAGEWTTESLGSVARISTEKVGDKAAIPMSITSGVGLVSQLNKFGRIIAGSSYANYLILKRNDFAYNKSATKEYPEGFIALYTGDELAAVPNSIFTCFRIIKRDSPVPQYLNYLLLGNLHGRWLRKFIEVGARAHGSLSINEDDFLALPVPLPSGQKSVAEQRKIVECLSSVDEVIAAHARKVDALKAHKKGLMQQLFPREGETQPRLQFPEFQNDGEWVETTIGDLKPFVTSGSRGWAPFYAEQGELFVRITNLWRDSIYLDLTDLKFVQLPSGAEGIRTQLKEHDVLISITADIGIIGYVDESIPSPAYINQHIALVRFDPGQLCGKYVAYFLASEKSQRLFRASTDTGTKAGMSLIGIHKIKLMLPGLLEQQRIASCLTSLDALITSETQKLEALNRHKRGLMRQLFPSPEDAEHE